MSIHNSASDTDKQRTFCHFSGVINNTGNFLLGISLYGPPGAGPLPRQSLLPAARLSARRSQPVYAAVSAVFLSYGKFPLQAYFCSFYYTIFRAFSQPIKQRKTRQVDGPMQASAPTAKHIHQPIQTKAGTRLPQAPALWVEILKVFRQAFFQKRPEIPRLSRR